MNAFFTNFISKVKDRNIKMGEFQKPLNKYSCKFCEKSYSQLPSLRNYFKTVHEGFKFRCNLCDKTSLATERNLRNHIKCVHKGINLFRA